MGRRRRRRRRRRRSRSTAAAQPVATQNAVRRPFRGNMRNLVRRARQLPQPRFFEDYDRNNDGQLDVRDVMAWGQSGRRDVATRLGKMIGSGRFPNKRKISRPSPRRVVRRVYGIPRTRWMKMSRSARKAQTIRFQRSRRAAVQRTRRTRNKNFFSCGWYKVARAKYKNGRI